MILNGIGLKQILAISKKSLSIPHRYPQILHQFLLRLKMPNDTRAPFPSSAMIEPIARCNLKCPECPVGRGELKRSGIMKLEEFQAIWKSFQGKIAHVLLFNQGEPFMVQSLDQMIRECTKTKTYSITSTNAILLHKNNWAERLVDCGLNELIVSIDGITQTTFEQYRVGGRLETAIQGIQQIRKIRDASKKKYPILTMQMLLSKVNEAEWIDAIQFSKKIGCDGIVYKTMQLDRVEDPNSKIFLPSNPKLWRYIEKPDGTIVLRRKWKGCSRLWWHPVIHSDGELVPCCFDKNSEYSYGNVLKEGFTNVWNNSNAQLFRKAFLNSPKPPFKMCENCTEGLWAVELLPHQLKKYL
ncbi:MAG: SPASM domain-containing protein [bacterium]|nr:SPASM domain-containing protein [bacterium]